MKAKTSVLKQSTRLLKTMQEFIDTNPNEVATLADSEILIEAMSADLNPHEGAACDRTSRRAQISRLLETLQEFVNTHPNEVTALADSSRLIEAMCAELSGREVASVN
jgi:hypothetical protein